MDLWQIEKENRAEQDGEEWTTGPNPIMDGFGNYTCQHLEKQHYNEWREGYSEEYVELEGTIFWITA